MRDPASEEVIRELRQITGPTGSDQNPREIAEEMAELGLELSHERLRQLLGDEWDTVYRSTRRKIRTYIMWKKNKIRGLVKN